MQELSCHAILFDLDGVLVDSTACVERHWRRWATRHKLDAGSLLANSHGRRTIDTMRLVASDLDLDLEHEALLLEEEEALDLDGIIATPGAIELLTALPTQSWAIVTSATRIMARARLEAVGLPIPQAFICAEEVSQGKPHPEGYLKAATLLGIAPDQCLVIEDAPAGILAAHAAAIPALGVTTTFPIEKLREADIVTANLQHVHLTIDNKLADAHPRLTLSIESLNR
jgi:mannitol-1-/sugar-/sorbitol-6-phosphatase